MSTIFQVVYSVRVEAADKDTAIIEAWDVINDPGFEPIVIDTAGPWSLEAWVQ